MTCAEIANAIAWNKQSKGNTLFPVVAYFTKHFGYGDPYTASRDAVHYASGQVFAVDAPSPHLAGTLKGAKNTDVYGEMVSNSHPELTYQVEIFPDGKLSYLMMLDGHPVGGMPATQVQATCVQDVLLTATQDREVVAVGVARKPASDLGPP